MTSLKHEGIAMGMKTAPRNAFGCLPSPAGNPALPTLRTRDQRRARCKRGLLIRPINSVVVSHPFREKACEVDGDTVPRFEGRINQSVARPGGKAFLQPFPFLRNQMKES
jgi:hypothetical protein